MKIAAEGHSQLGRAHNVPKHWGRCYRHVPPLIRDCEAESPFTKDDFFPLLVALTRLARYEG